MKVAILQLPKLCLQIAKGKLRNMETTIFEVAIMQISIWKIAIFANCTIASQDSDNCKSWDCGNPNLEVHIAKLKFAA